MSLPPLQNVPCDVSLIVHSDMGREPDWISFFIPMAWAVACVSIFFCVHVFISRLLSSGNAVIAQFFSCEISHNSLDFISVVCDYEDFQRLDPSLLASCCPSVLRSILQRPARLLHRQPLSHFSSPSFFVQPLRCSKGPICVGKHRLISRPQSVLVKMKMRGF